MYGQMLKHRVQRHHFDCRPGNISDIYGHRPRDFQDAISIHPKYGGCGRSAFGTVRSGISRDSPGAVHRVHHGQPYLDLLASAQFNQQTRHLLDCVWGRWSDRLVYWDNSSYVEEGLLDVYWL